MLGVDSLFANYVSVDNFDAILLKKILIVKYWNWDLIQTNEWTSVFVSRSYILI